MPVLSDFSEGLIGKLQIRRSGKVQLLMGNVTLDVSEGAAFSFLQVSLQVINRMVFINSKNVVYHKKLMTFASAATGVRAIVGGSHWRHGRSGKRHAQAGVLT